MLIKQQTKVSILKHITGTTTIILTTYIVSQRQGKENTNTIPNKHSNIGIIMHEIIVLGMEQHKNANTHIIELIIKIILLIFINYFY